MTSTLSLGVANQDARTIWFFVSACCFIAGCIRCLPNNNEPLYLYQLFCSIHTSAPHFENFQTWLRVFTKPSMTLSVSAFGSVGAAIKTRPCRAKRVSINDNTLDSTCRQKQNSNPCTYKLHFDNEGLQCLFKSRDN